MNEPTALSPEALADALPNLPGWHVEDNRLVRTFSFGSFREAISFIVRIAFEAEVMNHHPEITNVYNRVRIALTTHDAGDRITAADVRLARRIAEFSWV